MNLMSSYTIPREDLWAGCTFHSKRWVQSLFSSLKDPIPATHLGVKPPLHFWRSSSFICAGRAGNAMTLPQKIYIARTKLISEHANSGQGREALIFYEKMREEGIIPNSYTFVAALKACSIIADLEAGKRIHAHVIESGQETDAFVANALVGMYVKCGSINDARHIFENMTHRTVVSWNAMITGYVRMEMGHLALELYARMQHEGFVPDARTFVAALKACGSLVAQEEGRRIDRELLKIYLERSRAIHTELARRGLESDVFIANTLVDVYAKCGSTEDARQVFEKMKCRSIVSWNAMIIGYAQMDMGELALELYARMQLEGFTPTSRTYVAALKACASLAAQAEDKGSDNMMLKKGYLEQGRAIHAELVKGGFHSDIFVASTLVDMYAKCGSIEDAREVFENMKNRDAVTWTAMIMGYAQMNMGESALELYACMQSEGFTPVSRTFVAALKACSSLAIQQEENGINHKLPGTSYLEKGRTIHAELAKRGIESDLFVANALIDMYTKYGSIEDARQVFEKMTHRDDVSWTTMILGYAQVQMGNLALELYALMEKEGFAPGARTFVAILKACGSLAAQQEDNGIDGELLKASYLKQGRAIHAEVARRGFESDVFIASTLVDMYAKCGSIEDARRIFEKMKHRNVVPWTAMILGYAQMDMGDAALELYACMQQEGVPPDAHTFVAALKACGCVASLETGKEIHSEIQRLGLENQQFIASCLIDMYGKCGSMIDAQHFFDSLLVRSSVTWNALIGGYSGQGDTESTLASYRRMQQEGISPDSITFVSVLTVCSHNGLVENGKTIFQAMCRDYGISPSKKHYMCMADLLGRAGQLEEALAMVKNMPFKPDIVTWTTILGNCQKWNNVEIGRIAFECVVSLDEKLVAAYVLMINIYVSAQMWDESSRIREMRTKARAWKKQEQCRWTDVNGAVHTFTLGDKSHPQSKEISLKLKDLFIKTREEHFMHDLDIVSPSIPVNVKEDVMCGHSEKMAIACALINTPPGTPIRIVKSVQVCDDCHRAIALISKIEERTIICRDASLFHVFSSGKCSCGNFQ